MNIEKIKNFSQDEQKTLNYFELIRNEIVERDNELNEGIDFIFGRKFAAKIDLLLNLVITLEEDKEKLQKENEELKKDRKNNNEMIALAQNEILNYMSAYEEGKKHKMTAVAQVVENQQYYIVQKQMEKYEEHIKRLQKENEELKETYKSEKKMKNEYVKLYQDLLLKENVITVQKIKDKIEEYKNMLKTCNKVKDIDRIKAINERILELEELLEGRE